MTIRPSRPTYVFSKDCSCRSIRFIIMDDCEALSTGVLLPALCLYRQSLLSHVADDSDRFIFLIRHRPG